MLVDLPEVIFQLIQTFLSNDDYHFFLNTSKQFFAELKKRTIIFRLSEKACVLCMDDLVFATILLSKVDNGWDQIQFPRAYKYSHPKNPLNLESLQSLRFAEEVPLLPSTIKELKLGPLLHLRDVKNLSQLSRLEIRAAHKLEDISQLKDVPDLTVVACQMIDFSRYVTLQTKLSLKCLGQIRDCHPFRHVRHLSLINCASLEDVSPLHGVYDLRITYCEKVKDISGLGGHYRLEISFCFHNLRGYESLLNIPHIILSQCDISDVSVLRYAKSVELLGCDSLIDISPINHVKRVNLRGNDFINNISELCNVYDLSIDIMPVTREDLSKLRNHKLFIDYSKVQESTTEEGGEEESCIQYLTVKKASLSLGTAISAGRVACFQHLQSLTLTHSDRIRYIRGLEDIPTVKLILLESLVSISGLGRNRCVELRQCQSITDVSSLANVQIVTIENCQMIENYIVLSKVPRLKILSSNRFWTF